MKLTTCFILSLILVLGCHSANGKFQDLFDGVHNKLHKAGEDIHNIIFPTDKEPNFEHKAWSQQNPNPVPKTSESPINQDVKQFEATTPTSTTETVVNLHQTETSSTTEKGRENFSGNCLPGYLRTADGRCKPSF